MPDEKPAYFRHGDTEIELPIVRGTENELGVDISKLRAETGVITLDYGFMNTGVVRVGDHLHRRRRRHPALPRHPDRAARRARAPVVPRDLLPPDLRRAAHRRPSSTSSASASAAHAPARRREELLRRLPEGRPPDGDPVVGGQRAVDLLPGQRRPARPRAGPALDPAADGEDPDDRGVLLQEVDRPAVPLPGQPARPHRELPHDDVRGAVGAVRGQPDGRARAQAAAHPARRPRAELLHVAPCAWSARATRTCSRRSPPASTRCGARCTAARTRPSSRCSSASATTAATSTKYVQRAKDPNDPFRLSGLRSPRVQELRPAGPHPQGRRPTG